MGFLDFPRNVYNAMIDVPVHFVTHFTDDLVERTYARGAPIICRNPSNVTKPTISIDRSLADVAHPVSASSADTGWHPLAIWGVFLGFLFLVYKAMKFMQHLESMSILELPLARVAGNPKNVRVFMEFEAASSKDGTKKDVGRVEFELFSAALPRTCENFRSFCTGERGNGVQSGKPMHYKGVRLHRVIKGFMTQGGDTVRGDGTGTESIFGPMFPDEWAENKTHVKHQKAGMLAMANAGPDTNGSQFYVTHRATAWLDGKHVVFGQVVDGMERIEWIEANAGSASGTPAVEVVIKDCGEVKSKST